MLIWIWKLSNLIKMSWLDVIVFLINKYMYIFCIKIIHFDIYIEIIKCYLIQEIGLNLHLWYLTVYKVEVNINGPKIWKLKTEFYYLSFWIL